MSAKRKTLHFSPRARQDLEDIWLYTLQQWSPAQADSYASDLFVACNSLAVGEKTGVSAEYIRAGYWKYFSGSHAIYYTVADRYLDVIRILHQSRDAGAHL